MNKPLTTVKPRAAKSKEAKSRTAEAKAEATAHPAIEFGSTLLEGSELLQKVQIKWLDSGKPVLEGLEGEAVEVSLSHDDQVCLCVAGHGPQGCDIAPVTHRLREDWTALLSAERELLMQQLLAAGSDSVDRAGTRIWAAIETLRKATNERDIDLTIDRQEGDSVLFRGTASGSGKQLYILTFPLALTWGLERIVAVVVSNPRTASNSLISYQTNITAGRVPSLQRDGHNQTIYRMNIAEENEKVFVLRWPVSYKETTNLSQSVYFSNFFAWMGKVRDLAIWPIREPLGQQLITGEWGMVTNHAQTQILGQAGLNDVIEVRFWVAKVSGPTNSTVDFHYDWLKVLPDGGFERIALSELCMTWVQIPKQGTAEPKPLPDFLENFINQLWNPTHTPQPLPESLKDTDLGEELYRAPTGPIAGPLLREQSFETSLEDTDAIGNINFASYSVLQGRIRDSFFHKLVPECYSRTGNQGEFRCLRSRVEYLREAMPFEQIQVNMSLQAVYEHGISLIFEYFRLTPDGSRQKIAIGEHDTAWFTRGETGKAVPAPLLQVVQEALLRAVEA